MALPPHPDPGRPDARGPGRYLWWLVRSQPWRVLRGAWWGTVWMVCLAVQPYLIRGAIDHGLVTGDRRALAWWTVLMVALGLVIAGSGLGRHRTMTLVRTDAAYRTVQVVTRHVARLGAMLPKRVATGEVVTIGTTDIMHISHALTSTGPGVGAVVAGIVVTVLVLAISPLLGLLVLLTVPVVALVVGPLLNRLRRVEAEYRRRQGELTAHAGDIVAGLRVLRGVGGEGLFAGHYRNGSQDLRVEGYRVGAVTSWIRALMVGLPSLWVAVVVWLAARLAAQGDISAGELVAVYAYAAVLSIPVLFLVEGAYGVVRGLVCARRVVNLLNLHPEVTGSGDPVPLPGGPADLHDPGSGLTVRPGELLAVASADTGQLAALADRLGHYTTGSGVTYGGVPLRELAVSEVRRRILVAEGGSYLFAGALRDMIRPARRVDEAAIGRCLTAAAADDIVAGLPAGLDSPVDAQARTLSGGQRQRLRLARALLADPEVLILLEPTSAVDAHTEAAVADRLRQVRAGRTTVVVTSSPLLLDRADRVAYLVDGRVEATGSHVELMAGCPGYRALVVRGAEAEPVAAEADR